MMSEISMSPLDFALLEPGSPMALELIEQRDILRSRTHTLSARDWGKWLLGSLVGAEIELPSVPYAGRDLSQESLGVLAEGAIDGTHGLPNRWKDGYLRTKAAVLLGMSALRKPEGADIETAKSAAEYLANLSRRCDGTGSLLAAKILLHKLNSF